MSSRSDDASDLPIGTASAPPARRPERKDRRALMDALEVERAVRRATRRRGRVTFWLAVAWVALVLLVAIFADVIPLHPYDQIVDGLGLRIRPRLSFTEPLGTDYLGRSVTSRLAYGARQSLIIGVGATTIALSIGTILGIAAGYFRGWFDAVIGILVDTVLAIPGLVLLLAIASVGKRDTTTIVVGLAILGIPTVTRLARATTLARASRDHVLAARAMGARSGRIVFRELLPDVVLPVSSFGFLILAVFIVVEATLSFLGLGVPPPSPSWGGMINNSRPYLETDPLLIFLPALCILFTVVSFTVIGDNARRRFDVRQSALD